MEEEEQTTVPLNGKPTGTVQSTGPPKWRSNRFILAYMMMLGNMMVFFQRVSFSMVIICMVNHTALDIAAQEPSRDPGNPHWNHTYSNNTGIRTLWNDSSIHFHAGLELTTGSNSASSSSNAQGLLGTELDHNSNVKEENDVKRDIGPCDRDVSRAAKENTKKEDGPFVWDKETQGLLLGAVYWGYMSAQIVAAYTVYKYGSRCVCSVSMVLMSLCTVLCHPAAFWSPWAVFALRVCIGICTSFCIPGMYAMWAKWAPSGERATLVSLSFSGQNVANALAFPTAALLCKEGFAGGWPSVFYVYGGLGIVWTVAWWFVVSDSPETLPRIHPEEKDLIMTHRGHVYSKGDKVSVPWCEIFRSMCFWAIAAAHVSFTWGLFLFMSNLPLYMYEVMNFDIKSNGFYSMLPYIALGLVQGSGGFISDIVVKRQLMNVFWTRRLFCAIANLIPAVCVVAMSFLDCNDVPAVMGLLITSVGVTGFAFSAFLVNPFDIAPRYAISITCITNSLACIPGILTPYVVAEVTKDKTREQWQIIFFITAAVYVAGTLVFVIFAKTDLQSWASPKPSCMEINVTQDDCQTVHDREGSEDTINGGVNGHVTKLTHKLQDFMTEGSKISGINGVNLETEPLTNKETEIL